MSFINERYLAGEKLQFLQQFFLLEFPLKLVTLPFTSPEDTEAGWKFWKKKDKDDTTTEPPVASSTPTTTTIRSVPNNPAPGSVNKALAGAADPGLAIGSGTSGQNIRNTRPQRPNPGTEVGQDFPGSRPSNPGIGGGSGQGYRDWAADLTGAGDPSRPAPKLPGNGPAVSPGSTPGSTRPAVPNTQPGSPAAGNSPATPNSHQPGSPSIPNSHQPSYPSRSSSPAGGNSPVTPAPKQGPPTPGPRPGSPSAGSTGGSTGGLYPGYGAPGAPGGPGQGHLATQTGPAGRPQVSTLNVGPVTPAPAGQRSPSAPASPGGKTWADVAGGGSRPASPTPEARPGQPGSGHTGSNSRISPGGLAAGAVGVAGAAGVAGIANGAKKTYTTNPIYSKGNAITDDDLEKLTEALWLKDNNNAWRHVKVNLQRQTSSSSGKDEASEP